MYSDGALLVVWRNAFASPGIKESLLKKQFNDGLKRPYQKIDKDELVVFLGERRRVQVGELDDSVTHPTPVMLHVIKVLTRFGPLWMSETDLEEQNGKT